MNTSSFLALCVFIVYVMFDKNTILKIKYLLNYFQTGHLLDASGKRTIFSSAKMSVAIYLLYGWKENESTGKIGIEYSWSKY